MASMLDETWQSIEPSLYIILGDENNSSLDTTMYSETYTRVYNYCTTSSSKKTPQTLMGDNGTGVVKLVGGDLYDKVKSFLKVYLDGLSQRSNESYLEFYIRSWQRFQIGAKRLNDILDYLNRYWVNKERAGGHRDVYDIFSLCLLSWRDYKFHPNLPTLMDQLMEQIHFQRIGSTDFIKNIHIAVQSFVSLGFEINDLKKTNLSVYINDFEKRFLTETHNFYDKESRNYITENGVVNYVIKAQQRIDEELKKLEDLNDHSRRPLNQVLNVVLIQNHQDAIRNELDTLLDQERYDDVKKIHNLLKRVPLTIPPLLEKLQKYIENQGLEAIIQLKNQSTAANNAKLAVAASSGAGTEEGGSTVKVKRKILEVDPKQYIKSLIGVYKRYQKVIELAFDKNESFVKALDSACQQFINKNIIATPTAKSQSKTPQLLTKYIDEMLTKKSADLSIDEMMIIFNFLEDKESFETWYRRTLSRRLMSGNMTADDEEMEEMVVQRLKNANSGEYTNKITNMFNDIRTSTSLGDFYRERVNELGNASKQFINGFDPKILDNSSWESVYKQSDESLILPKGLIKTKDLFTECYQERHNGKQLNWLWSRSKIEIKANISKQGKIPFQFTLTMFQYSILSNFEEIDSLSTTQLLSKTGLSLETFKLNMIPFVKLKLLIQSPPGEKNLSKPNTTFTIVKEYSSKKVKINFSQNVKVGDSKNEEKETNEEVERRKHELLKAGIVRLMKARKELKHEKLSIEVFEIIDRFRPTVSEIKKAIEVLIDEQYLARDEEGNGYKYLS